MATKIAGRDVKEHPIIFSGKMVRAILAGKKTQTRRVIVPQPEPAGYDPTCNGGVWDWMAECNEEEVPNCCKRLCPYGVPGDRLWVRESWGYRGCCTGGDPEGHTADVTYKADDAKRHISFRTFDKMMAAVPKQNIKHTDSCDYDGDWYCECITKWWHKQKSKPSIHMFRWAARIFLEVVNVRVERVQDITETEAISEGVEGGGGHPDFWVGAFRDLWDSINSKRGYGWEVNPWVWVVEFKVVTK